MQTAGNIGMLCFHGQDEDDACNALGQHLADDVPVI